MTRIIPLLCILIGAAQLSAQPATLKWKLDNPAARRVEGDQVRGDTTWHLNPMPPGWHVTTGTGILLFDPTQPVTGQYSIEAYAFLFPNPSESGLGIFVGGRDMDGAAPSYLLFSIRRDGNYQVERHTRGQAQVLQAWKPDTAIKVHPVAQIHGYRIRVTARPDSILLLVEGARVTAVAREQLADGVFGVRIGPALNVHVSNLDYIRHLAPIRGPGH